MGRVHVGELLANEIRRRAHKVRYYLLYEQQWIKVTTGGKGTKSWLAHVCDLAQKNVDVLFRVPEAVLSKVWLLTSRC